MFYLQAFALAPFLTTSKPIQNEYIVVVHEDYTAHHAENNYQALFSQPANHFKINNVVGYHTTLSSEELETVRQHPHVEFVEQDQKMSISFVEKDAPWGLSRLSHDKPVEPYTYEYTANAGKDVTVYVVDTGCNAGHSEFEGRAMSAVDFTQDKDNVDGNGHGTHVSGTIAGKTFGVAKFAHVVCVKVLAANGSGSNSGVIRGIEWVINHHKSRGGKSAANMSLGGGKSKALDRVVDAAVEAGVHFVVAAGNDDADACHYSPAASKLAVTVGATTVRDRLAWFSNHGKCVDILAPGKDILSSWIGGENATNVISGTSMASPHVAGLVATYLGEAPKDLDHDAMVTLLDNTSVKDVIGGLPDPDKGNDPDWPFPWPPRGGSGGETPNKLAHHTMDRKVQRATDLTTMEKAKVLLSQLME